MKVCELWISPEKDRHIAVESLSLSSACGVQGDRFAAKTDRQVSLLAGEVKQRLRQEQGLCTSRFCENITTQGLDYTALHLGDQLQIGEAVLEITQMGKPCFPGCALQEQGKRCALTAYCAFARIQKDGVITVGTRIECVR